MDYLLKEYPCNGAMGKFITPVGWPKVIGILAFNHISFTQIWKNYIQRLNRGVKEQHSIFTGIYKLMHMVLSN